MSDGTGAQEEGHQLLAEMTDLSLIRNDLALMGLFLLKPLSLIRPRDSMLALDITWKGR